MENASDPELPRILLDVTLVLLALATFATAIVVARAARRLGPVVARERGARLGRAVIALVLAAATVAVVLLRAEVPLALCLAALALSAALLALAPVAHDSAIGESGVRRGWHVRTFAELEEWRLTGEHLRWRLFGEWCACALPLERHDELRAKLVAACPERESPFKS
jgi:hypothetical protein